MPLRLLTGGEVEKIRIVLSVYQDGSGMVKHQDGTLPGWRDFERTVALVLRGEAQEDKSIFDVLLPSHYTNRKIGISCKMRSELDRVDRTGRVYFELSNSEGKFWNRLGLRGIHKRNYLNKPGEVGHEVISLVEGWHHQVSVQQGGLVELRKSFYLVLSWNTAGDYQLYQFPIVLPSAHSLRWRFPSRRCLRGEDAQGTLFEWYGESGGQLKYYPLASSATWVSKRFRLEPIPPGQGGILGRVRGYFPSHHEALWS